jgi:hypothetical protein
MTPSPHAAPRVVELFGPSSGGKSSLGERLLREGGGRFVLHTDRVLASVGLGWLPSRLLRTFAVDAVAALEVVATWRRHSAFYRGAAAQALRGAGPGSWRTRLMLLRNAWKGGALCILAGRLARPGEVVLMDEGPLQTANYLFVHVDAPPAREALGAYLATLPLPDGALYVRAGAEELVARTLARTHARVPKGSREATQHFVAHAVEVFERVAAEARVRERLVTLEQLLGRREQPASGRREEPAGGCCEPREACA